MVKATRFGLAQQFDGGKVRGKQKWTHLRIGALDADLHPHGLIMWTKLDQRRHITAEPLVAPQKCEHVGDTRRPGHVGPTPFLRQLTWREEIVGCDRARFQLVSAFVQHADDDRRRLVDRCNEQK